MPEYPKPPYPAQRQPMPGATAKMNPRPDHGETSYKGSGKLAGKKAVITGGDSGIGRAVAIAYAREGADILIAYLDEHQDAQEVKGLVEHEGRKAVLVAGDLRSPQHCRAVIKQAVDVLGGIDILINNAAHQATFKDIGDISDEEWQLTFEVNIHAMFYLTKAAVHPHEAWQRDRQYGVGQFRYAKSDTACVRDDKRRDPELYRRTGANAGSKGYPRKTPWRQDRSGRP